MTISTKVPDDDIHFGIVITNSSWLHYDPNYRYVEYLVRGYLHGLARGRDLENAVKWFYPDGKYTSVIYYINGYDIQHADVKEMLSLIPTGMDGEIIRSVKITIKKGLQTQYIVEKDRRSKKS